MATITRSVSDLELARERLDEATASDAALHDQHRQSRDVSETALLKSRAAMDLAGLAVEGLEQAELDDAAAARLAGLTELRNEILDRADPAPVIAAAERIVADVALIVAALGPERSKALSRQLAELRRLDVPETGRGDQPAPEDAELGWYGPGMVHGSPRIAVGASRVIMPIDLGQLLTALISAGCRKAGVHPQAAAAAGAPPSIVADPAGWLTRSI